MFMKEFKVKATNAMKTSERKALQLQILRQYPVLGPDQLKEYMPMGQTIFKVRVVTQRGEQMNLYTNGDQPAFFKIDYDDVLYPSIFTLWKWPGLLPMFTTMEEVWPRLQNGADLMCPGVLLPPVAVPHANAWGTYPKGMLVGINLNTNSATYAIGMTALSSYDMYVAGGRGKCVNIVHRYNDAIWQYAKDPIPQNGPPTWITMCESQGTVLKTVGETIREMDNSQTKKNPPKNIPIIPVMSNDLSLDLNQYLQDANPPRPPEHDGPCCSCSHTGAIPKRRLRRRARRNSGGTLEPICDPTRATYGKLGQDDMVDPEELLKKCAEALVNIDKEDLGPDSLHNLEEKTFVDLCETVCRSCIDDGNENYKDYDTSESSTPSEHHPPSSFEKEIEAYIYNENPDISVEKTDALLKYSLLKAIKEKDKDKQNIQLPMLVSTFFRNHMLASLPSVYKIDIKKSSYKKLKKFLQVMQEGGLLKFTESKNVQSVISLNASHELVTNFEYMPEDTGEHAPGSIRLNPEPSAPPVVIEYWTITTPVLFIFNEFGFSRGESMTELAIRKHVVYFVRKRNLARKQLVSPDVHLAGFLGSNQPILMDVLFKRVMDQMTPCYKIDSQTKMHKGKLQPISMVVQTRSGNKKVTLVDNLEVFGINIHEFAKECQQAVGASTSVSKPPGKKNNQLLVQGNQILYISRTLMEKYKIQRHYMRGFEYAPKVPKSKRK